MYTAVFNMRVFFEDCNDWGDKAEGCKTWETFKFDGIGDKRQQKRYQRETTKMGSFHREN